jgi:uncharacterized protein YecT (DUF1311 family)
MMEPERRSDVRRSVRTPNWSTLALIGALIVVLLLLAYVATTRNPDQDKLTHNELTQAGNPQQAAQPAKGAPEKLCANNETYDLIKHELFRRAAQLRGSDQAAFDQLSAYAVVRMDNPVLESRDSSTGGVNCSGTLSLDLPPGVAIIGNHRTLTADVDYTVQPAADGSGNVVLLRNADTIIGSLATLARVGQASSPQPAAPPAASPPATRAPAVPQQQMQPAPEQARPVAVQPSARPSSVVSGARPSFDCAKARTKGEIAVCSNAGLAALDRNMSSQYRGAILEASPEQRALLRRTRDRFLEYRDRCPNRSCIGEAYVGRMREIHDIMEGTWRPHP